MAFNHYAKIKRILEPLNGAWIVHRINEPTKAKNFKGEIRQFDHYYRVYDLRGDQIPYCKFQQIELFAKTMNLNVEDIEVVS